MTTRTIPLDQFKAELIAQGVRSHEHFAFRCVMCGTIQSATSLIRARAGETFDVVEPYLGFSCVGRWTNAGPHKKGDPPGKGCDWTLGGLFGFADLQVETEDGKRHSRFEIASPEEAKTLMAAHDATTPAGPAS